MAEYEWAALAVDFIVTVVEKGMVSGHVQDNLNVHWLVMTYI